MGNDPNPKHWTTELELSSDPSEEKALTHF